MVCSLRYASRVQLNLYVKSFDDSIVTDTIVAEMAAKLTGMLLEMDQIEVLDLLETPEAPKAKGWRCSGVSKECRLAPGAG